MAQTCCSKAFGTRMALQIDAVQETKRIQKITFQNISTQYENLLASSTIATDGLFFSLGHPLQKQRSKGRRYRATARPFKDHQGGQFYNPLQKRHRSLQEWPRKLQEVLAGS